MRNAPAIPIIQELQSEGANIKVYDPVASENAQKILHKVQYCKDAYEVAQDAEALVLVTEWGRIREIRF